MDKKFVVFIQTFESPDSLELCLRSVELQRNRSLALVYVIDDSYSTNKQIENLAVVNSFGTWAKGQNLSYVNRERWEERKRLILSAAHEEFHELIHGLQLGEKGWNVGNARNISHLIFSARKNTNEQFISLDSDMRIDEKLFTQHFCNEPRSPKIVGCPDLSRLEWISFLTATLAAKHSLHFNSHSWYVERLRKLYNHEECLAIASHFSDLQNLDTKLPEKCFPQREEYYGGAYIASAENLRHAYVAPWYDNDWRFFQMTRDRQSTVEHLGFSVYHSGAKKNVLSRSKLLHEEIGKILNHAHTEISTSSRLKVIETNLRKRIEIVEYEASILKRVSKSSEQTVVTSYLDSLSEDLQHLDSSALEEDLSIFMKNNTLWEKMLGAIKGLELPHDESRSFGASLQAEFAEALS
jgi:hypothetical protein